MKLNHSSKRLDSEVFSRLGWVQDLRQHKCQDGIDPSHSTESAFSAESSQSLHAQATNSSPEYDFKTVEDEVGFEASPAVEAGDVLSQELVKYDDDCLASLFTVS